MKYSNNKLNILSFSIFIAMATNGVMAINADDHHHATPTHNTHQNNTKVQYSNMRNVLPNANNRYEHRNQNKYDHQNYPNSTNQMNSGKNTNTVQPSYSENSNTTNTESSARSAVGQNMQSTESTQTQSNWWMWIAGLALVGGGAGSYFLSKQKKNLVTDTNALTTSTTPNCTSMSVQSTANRTTTTTSLTRAIATTTTPYYSAIRSTTTTLAITPHSTVPAVAKPSTTATSTITTTHKLPFATSSPVPTFASKSFTNTATMTSAVNTAAVTQTANDTSSIPATLVTNTPSLSDNFAVNFLQAAIDHFEAVQLAKTTQNLEAVRHYFTPESLHLFEQQIQMQAETAKYFIVRAKLMGDAPTADSSLAVIRFSGLVKTIGPAKPFSQLWHLVPDETNKHKWLIADIE